MTEHNQSYYYYKISFRQNLTNEICFKITELSLITKSYYIVIKITWVNGLLLQYLFLNLIRKGHITKLNPSTIWFILLQLKGLYLVLVYICYKGNCEIIPRMLLSLTLSIHYALHVNPRLIDL